MPIKIQGDLPAKEKLEKENIFVMDETRATHQDIRPLQIVILNLMPLKEETELQLLRALSNTPIQVDVTFCHTTSYESKNTSRSHLNKFYVTSNAMKEKRYDGFIITGAPVELMEFEAVDYWDELKEIMKWSSTNVSSTLHICWGAQAGLFYHYGLKKRLLTEKASGLFRHRVLDRKVPLVRGFDDIFMAPHSRYTEVSVEDIENCEGVKLLAKSDEAGAFLAVSNDGKQIFVMGHPEYDRMTLDNEYKRDLEKGVDVKIPVNYYKNDDSSIRPELVWRSHANNLYTNWLNYYVYQQTPYKLDENA